MWHVGTGLPWDWRTGPSDSSEREHLRQMIESLPKRGLIAADAGFVGYEYWKEIINSGRDLLVRVGSNVRLLKKLGYVREKRGLVYLWPDQVAAKRMPPLVLRLVVVHDGRKPCYLVTSVLDDKQLSDKQVVQIYRRRWGSRCSTGTSNRPSSGASYGASRRRTPKSKPSGHSWDCGRWGCMPSRYSPQRESPPEGLVSRVCYGHIAVRCANTGAAPIRGNP